MPHFSAISSAEMPWGTRPPSRRSARSTFGPNGKPYLPSAIDAPIGTRRHDLDAGGDDDVVGAGDHALGGEVRGLLRRAALAVDGGAGHRLGEAGGEHGVAADVDALLADLHDAAHDHVVDERGVEVVALDERLERLGGEVDGVPVLQLAVALARAAVRMASTMTAVGMTSS